MATTTSTLDTIQDLARERERIVRELGKAVVDEPMAAMFPFWPGIREVDMQCMDGMRRKQVLEKVGRFDSHAAQVDQSSAPSFAVHFADTAEQSFDANEIVVQSAFGEVHQKCAITAA